MGISGLPKIIKETTGTLAHDLKTKKFVHVDLLSVYFGFIKARCYNVAYKNAAKEARAAAVAVATAAAGPSSGSTRSDYRTAGSGTSRKRHAAKPPELAPLSRAKRMKPAPGLMILDDIEHVTKKSAPQTELFLDGAGQISTQCRPATNPWV
jgi:hypothetical protein